jgi:hypothetical protein
MSEVRLQDAPILDLGSPRTPGALVLGDWSVSMSNGPHQAFFVIANEVKQSRFPFGKAPRQPLLVIANEAEPSRFPFGKALHQFLLVIANEVKQSKNLCKSKAHGSPRRCAPRDDGVLQSSLGSTSDGSRCPATSRHIGPCRTRQAAKGRSSRLKAVPCDHGALQTVLRAAAIRKPCASQGPMDRLMAAGVRHSPTRLFLGSPA